jgi:hypothetical protein
METISALPSDTGNTVALAADEAAAPPNAGAAPLRLAVRPDLLTAQRVEVAIILQAMLGTSAAAQYLENNAVDPMVAQRVLFQPQLRRGRHDASGILLT